MSDYPKVWIPRIDGQLLADNPSTWVFEEREKVIEPNWEWEQFCVLPIREAYSAPKPHPSVHLTPDMVQIKLPKGLLVLTFGEYRRGIKRGRACTRAAATARREPNDWPIGSNSGKDNEP